MTLWRMIGGGTRPFQDVASSASAWFFCGGLLLWLALYGIVPRPVRLYVLGHELSHALGAWLSGGGARGLRVGARGGSILVSADNFFVVLAPYFIPFYAGVVLAAYFVASLFIDPQPWYGAWMAALGLGWGFHLTFTVSALSRPQSDVGVYGHLFSYVMILWFNLLVLGLGLVLVATPTLEMFVTALGTEITALFSDGMRLFIRGMQ